MHSFILIRQHLFTLANYMSTSPARHGVYVMHNDGWNITKTILYIFSILVITAEN